jgi:hypothetical protein
MAKILMGPLASDARGRVGPIVFTHSAFSPGTRIKSKGRNPSTSQQVAIRGSLTGLAKRWSGTLSPSQRSGWLALAASYTRQDRFLQSYHMTGLQMYLSLNQSLKAIGQPYLDDAPLSLSVGAPLTCTLGWTPPSGPLTVSAGTPPGAHDVPTIFSTPMMNAGRRSVTASKRALTYFPAGTAAPWDITTAYNAKHGLFIAGRAVTVMLKYCDDRTGFQSALASQQQIL